MFGIGLPEMILILALALIVVGPDKLPDLARSVAKGVMELKKTAEALKKNLTEDGTIATLKSEINNTAQGLQNNLLESPDQSWKTLAPGEGVNPAPDKTEDKIAETSPSLVNDIDSADHDDQTTNEASDTVETADSAKAPTPIQHASQKP